MLESSLCSLSDIQINKGLGSVYTDYQLVKEFEKPVIPLVSSVQQ